jgi:hypothetical protein
MSQRLHTGLYDPRRWRVDRFVDVTFTADLVGAAFANLLASEARLSSRGTKLWMGHSRRTWIRDPHFACMRWKATPFELVAVKSWTGMVATPSELSRFLSARGMEFLGYQDSSRVICTA